ncbi:MAG: cbb3-type cytochrome c oxidase subunit I [Ilumatobacter sp.]|uniref:cbb3-type cytochrome c oxidase subunit I n=1 Tax=Ilumatobacter sp. TaxID=1967498 RepID=UPI00391A61A3
MTTHERDASRGAHQDHASLASERGTGDEIPDVYPTARRSATDEELDQLWDDRPGLWGKLTAVQNDAVGIRMVLTGFFFLLLGGSVDSFVMRLQLARPESELISPSLYNELFTNHGSVTMFLVILPIFEGFAILVLPTILGSREMPFPRLGAFAYWTFLMGGLLYYSSTLFQAVPNAGWFAYTPLSGPEFSPGLNLDFWVLGLGVAEVGAIAGAIEIIIAVLKLRAPGMSLTRLPLYAWSMLITAFMILFAFTPLIVGSLLLELERGFGMKFFAPDDGGSSLLWQHLFWIFGHPEVYIQFLPATGIISMVIPVMARRRIAGYTWMVAAMVGIGVLSFGLWAHHMFTVGLPPVVLAFFAAASMIIAIPAGVQIFSWIATIWDGHIRWSTSFLFAVGFLTTFVAGGITGVMVAAVPFDQQAHDSYFVVAHLHYVLIGGVAFPMFAGVYYWLPKFTGKLMSERLGRWNFWLLFLGLHVTFFPMHISGLLGMPRRIPSYSADSGWAIWNLISSLGLLLIIPGLAVFIVNVIRSYRSGEPAGANPWGADTLEWAVPSPPPQHSWTTMPIVRSRHPLWDQDDLYSGTPRQERLVAALGQWPLRWRAVLVVGVGDGEPEEIFRVSNPSIWPLVTAFGTVGVFASELLKLRYLALASMALIVFAVVMWNRPSPPPMTEQEEIDFEHEHGVPVRAAGSIVVARWGMGIALLFLSIAFGAFVLSYFYLRLENPVWPPAPVSDPSIGIGAAVIAATAVAAGLAWRARRRLLAGDVARLGRRVVGATAAGLLAGGILVRDLATTDFATTDHSYGSIFHTLGGFAVAVLFIALTMSTGVAVYAMRGHYTQRRFSPVDNLVRMWLGATGLVGGSVLVLYGAPMLT